MIEKIDYKTNSIKYFLKKYPKEMNLIIKNVSSLQDEIEVIFLLFFLFWRNVLDWQMENKRRIL